MTNNPMKPEATLLIAIGSALIHFEEFESEDGRPVDLDQARLIMTRPDVKAWISEMNAMAFLPVKRDKKAKPRTAVREWAEKREKKS